MGYAILVVTWLAVASYGIGRFVGTVLAEMDGGR